jgi:hypothetical protein
MGNGVVRMALGEDADDLSDADDKVNWLNFWL